MDLVGQPSLKASIKTSPNPTEMQIPAALSTLSLALEQLDSSLRDLGARLEPLMVPTPETGSTGDKLPSGAPLANALEDRAAHVRYLNSRVQSLLSGLQI